MSGSKWSKRWTFESVPYFLRGYHIHCENKMAGISWERQFRRNFPEAQKKFEEMCKQNNIVPQGISRFLMKGKGGGGAWKNIFKFHETPPKGTPLKTEDGTEVLPAFTPNNDDKTPSNDELPLFDPSLSTPNSYEEKRWEVPEMDEDLRQNDQPEHEYPKTEEKVKKKLFEKEINQEREIEWANSQDDDGNHFFFIINDFFR
jgi:hypothetical protein